MNKVVIVVLLVIVSFAAGFFVSSKITGNAINNNLDNYSWTKAICNSERCIDVVIYCNNGHVEKIVPTSYEINISKDFVDNRNISKYC